MLIHTSCHGYCFLMSRYFAGKVVPIITTFISEQRKIQENYFPKVFNIGFLFICGVVYWAIVSSLAGSYLIYLTLYVPLAYRINDWFQHDGAPPHFSRHVREILDNQYPQGWIGRGGPHHWPARSPDLNPLDFFLWGHLKSLIYRRPINSEADLRVFEFRRLLFQLLKK
jgi:hypothetical protein